MAENIDTEYTVDRQVILGRGSYGFVFSGTWKNEVGVQLKVAMKRIQLADVQNDQHEEDCLRNLSHDNVVKLYESKNDEHFRYYILELCDASLDQVFLNPDDSRKYKGPNLPHYVIVLFQLATGLEYIHSKKLIHRDVKPENVLIFVNSANKAITLKWADFGLSRPVSERGTYQMSKIVGTENWMAPELLDQRNRWQSNDAIELRGTVKSDVFALGLVFSYYLNDGKHPYAKIYRTILKIKNLTKYKKISIKTFWKKQSTFINLQFSYKTTEFKTEHLFLRNVIRNMLKPETKRVISSEVIKQLTEIKTKDGSNILGLLSKECQNVNLLDIVKILVDNEIDVNCKNSDGWNALIILCRYYKNENLLDIVKLLVEKGIDVNSKDSNGRNALFILFRNYTNENLLDIVRLLVEKGIDVNSTDSGGWNVLLFLCRYYTNENLLDIIRLLVENGIDVNCKDSYGWNALFSLCKNYTNENLLDIVRLLVEKGIDVKCKYSDGVNALLPLCQNYTNENLLDIIKLLAEKHIDVNCKDSDGVNALLLLCLNYTKKNLLEIIKLLVEKGIEVNSKTSNGSNALILLCRYYTNENLLDIARLLVEKEIDVNCMDSYRWNALFYLCKNYHKENLIGIIELLVEKGIDVNSKDFGERNALFFLQQSSKSDQLNNVVQLFADRGIDIN